MWGKSCGVRCAHVMWDCFRQAEDVSQGRLRNAGVRTKALLLGASATKTLTRAHSMLQGGQAPLTWGL